MKIPWYIDSKAFEPFYDQTVAIRGQGQALSLKACVFEEDFDEPLSEISPSADRRHISVFVPKRGQGGWNCETQPKRGDVLTVTSWGGAPGTDEFSIERVQDFLDCWRISAREIRR